MSNSGISGKRHTLTSTPPFCCRSLIRLSSHTMASSLASEASSTTTRGVNLEPLLSTDGPCCILASPRAPAPERWIPQKMSCDASQRQREDFTYIIYIFTIIIKYIIYYFDYTLKLLLKIIHKPDNQNPHISSYISQLWQCFKTFVDLRGAIESFNKGSGSVSSIKPISHIKRIKRHIHSVQGKMAVTRAKPK